MRWPGEEHLGITTLRQVFQARCTRVLEPAPDLAPPALLAPTIGWTHDLSTSQGAVVRIRVANLTSNIESLQTKWAFRAASSAAPPDPQPGAR